MDLNHRFEVAAPVADAWPAFLDMPRLAPCMPGAEVTEVIDDRNVNGAAKVKVGPVNLRFAGQAEMVEVDDAARSAKMVAKGSDAKGRGNAEAEVNFSLHEVDPTRTAVEVSTSLNLTGSVAQYGRASGLIDEIANQLIADFVRNLEAELAPDVAEPTEPTATEMEADTPTANGRPTTVEGSQPIVDHDGASAKVGETPTKVNETTGSASEVSGLTLLFKALLATIKKWFRR